MDKTFIIAEAGVNHNGSLELAIKLCDAAKEVGADAVKFQTFLTDNLLTKDVGAAEYQQEHTGHDSQYMMLKQLELSFEEFRAIKQHCELIGIQFMSTPDDSDSLAFLIDLGVSPIKIGSGEINNIPYLREIGATKSDIILSTGMASLAEIATAIDTLQYAGAGSITLLHCTTNYPCASENVNLRAMLTMKDEFGLSVGFSDHTQGILAATAAVAMGARVIEKHFTLDTGMAGPDHKSSLDPKSFKEMVIAIRDTEMLLGTGTKAPQPSELEVMRVVRRKIVAARPITRGEKLTEQNLLTKRANYGLDANMWDRVVGQIASRDFQKDEGIDL